MYRDWLIENADAPIRRNLTANAGCAESLLSNYEVQYWLGRLGERAESNQIGDVHGSHDYRMENILGKCWILGLSKSIPEFSRPAAFIPDFLSGHVKETAPEKLSFGKIYAYRDYETVLGCFLPMLGYSDESAVQYITNKRIDILYGFTRQRRYDIYVDGSKFGGVKKEWRPYIIDPDLYADGNIALPSAHDYILFAGMYDKLTAEQKNKVELIVQWLFDDEYAKIIRRYGYFYIPGGAYNTKAVIFKMHLPDFENPIADNSELTPLLFTCFILSHFGSARETGWFSRALSYLDGFRNPQGRYVFPRHMITEKPDMTVVGGGHMNVGENKKAKRYGEIVSTYWMELIRDNVNRNAIF